MRHIINIFGLFLFILPGFASAQRIDQAASYRSVTGNSYIRLHYDNDFFAKSDYYYTQGYSFEVVTPGLRHNPLSKLLIRIPKGHSKYGLAFEHYGFTPTSIKSNDILYNDRPFAGIIMLKSFLMSTDTLHRSRLSTVLSTGMIGPAAFAGKMQTTIHRWSGDVEPRGWQHQIRNDLIINYEVNYQKEFINYKNLIALNSDSQIRIGTLSTKVQAGLTLKTGTFISSFNEKEKRFSRNFQLYVYNQPLVSYVAYDASLRGGAFTTTSPYTLQSSQISSVTFQNNLGIVANVWRFYAEYYQTFLTREFKTGRAHRWGGVKFGFVFN